MWVLDIWNGEGRERDVELEGASLAVMYAASAAQKLWGCKNGSFGTAYISVSCGTSNEDENMHVPPDYTLTQQAYFYSQGPSSITHSQYSDPAPVPQSEHQDNNSPQSPQSTSGSPAP